MTEHMQLLSSVYSCATRTAGFITTQQLRSLGVPSATTARWNKAGILHRVQQGVYRTTATSFDFDEAMQLASLVLPDGYAIGARSALQLWSLPGGVRARPTVVGPRGGKIASQHFTLTQSVDLGPVDLTRRQGVSVTTPLRSLIDASPQLAEHQVGEVLTAGVQRGEFTYDDVQIRLAELGRRGRRGINKIRKVLLARPEAGRPLNTYEKISKRTIGRAGFPPPVPQFPISVGGRTYFVDFAWPEFGLVMECDSMLAHSTPEQLQSDLRRQNRLVAAGWTVIRFTYWDIVDNPDRLIETLSQFLPRQVD